MNANTLGGVKAPIVQVGGQPGAPRGVDGGCLDHRQGHLVAFSGDSECADQQMLPEPSTRR